MEFFINQHSTSPLLVMRVINDGRNDYRKLHEGIENSCITFAMRDIETGIYKVAHKTSGYIQKDTIHPDSPKEYLIFYRWKTQDTNKPGRYEGQFRLRLYNTNEDLIIPIREPLIININESFVKTKTC